MATSSRGPAGRRGGGIRAAVEAVLPRERFGDHRDILSGTAQNIVGLGVFVVAGLGTNILISRVLGAESLGVVTLATQFAFVVGAATRFGMDMAAVRRVAIEVGGGEGGRARGVVARAVLIAGVASLAVAAAVFFLAAPIARIFGLGDEAVTSFRAAALAVPFVALCQVYLGGTRGLKIMRHTLYVWWAGQPLAWIALTLLVWALSPSTGATVLAYALSWVLATLGARIVWRRESRRFSPLPVESEEAVRLLRYGAPRAPAALLAQLLFWADYFVVSRYVSAGELGVYAAAVRVGQALVLFLIAVNYMFSPYVADLHARGERERLDRLYKSLTRWTLAGTVPLLLLLAIVPGPVLSAFGGGFEAGTTALRILLAGQLVNVAVGSVGFILIMTGRTGWDLAVYAASFSIDVLLAFALAPAFGIEGAAIAQAVTLAVSNLARLYLVRRFVRIWPFDRRYIRLLLPALVGATAMAGAHLLASRAGWPIDLAGSLLAGWIAYSAAMVWVGLSRAERGALQSVLARSRGRTG